MLLQVQYLVYWRSKALIMFALDLTVGEACQSLSSLSCEPSNEKVQLKRMLEYFSNFKHGDLQSTMV